MEIAEKFLLAEDGVFANFSGHASLDLTTLKAYPRVSKAWGEEIWLVNTPRFCAKLLLLNHGWRCSLHHHLDKSEWFMSLQGSVMIQSSSETIPATLTNVRLDPGQSFDVPQGLWHRFWTTSYQGAILLEVSSHHEDADVERFEESSPVEPF